MRWTGLAGGVSGSRGCQRVGSDGRAGAICANGSVETLLGGVARTRRAQVRHRERAQRRGCDDAAERAGIRESRAVVSERRRARLPGPVVVGREGREGGGRGERRAVGRLALGGWERGSAGELERGLGLGLGTAGSGSGSGRATGAGQATGAQQSSSRPGIRKQRAARARGERAAINQTITIICAGPPASLHMYESGIDYWGYSCCCCGMYRQVFTGVALLQLVDQTIVASEITE